MKKFVTFLLLVAFAGGMGWTADKITVDESFSTLTIKAEAPIPSEIPDEAQARKFAEEAAVTWGQNQILATILKKKTRSGKLLAIAEMPSLELQKEIRDYVKTAKAENVSFTNKICRLNLVLPKAPLKAILRKN